ncbi:MAG TPA: hypothetical protein DIS90_15265 [Cytophagales bacterium]|nr:hypothetical protein [Cytophagales bacterium]
MNRIRLKQGIAILFSLMVLFSPGANGQKLSGGSKLGINISNAKIKQAGVSQSSEATPGVHIGIYLKIVLSDKLNIQPEVLYSQQGHGRDINKEFINYCNIPIMMGYQFTKALSLQAGPQIGLLLLAMDNHNQYIKNALNDLNLSIGIGLGLDLPAGFNLSTRYVSGLTNDANLKAIGMSPGELKFTQSNIMFSIGYRLFSD